jgi:SAM-dependent methyltransferase
MRHPDILGQGTVQVVLAAREVGLLDALDGEPATAAEHSSRLGLDGEATRLLLDALCAIGYLRRENERYLSTAWKLDGRMVWDLLPGFLRRGERAQFIDRGEQRGGAYARVVRKLSQQAQATAEALAERLAPAQRILDVGAGAGAWSLAMLQRWPDSRAIALDLPEVLPNYQQRAAELGVSDRASTLAGNYFDAALPEVDRVILASVLHLEEPDDAERLLRRCADCLARGGDLVVIDCLPSGSDEAALFHALYSIHLRMRTAKGAVHPTSLVRQWCLAAGFSEVQHMCLDETMPGGGLLWCRQRH